MHISGNDVSHHEPEDDDVSHHEPEDDDVSHSKLQINMIANAFLYAFRNLNGCKTNEIHELVHRICLHPNN